MVGGVCLQYRHMRFVFVLLVVFIVVVLVLTQFKLDAQSNFSINVYQSSNRNDHLILSRRETFLELVRFYVKSFVNQTSSEANTTSLEMPKFMSIIPDYDPRNYKEPLVVDWFSYENYDMNDELDAWSRALYEDEHVLFMDLFKMMVTLLGELEVEFMLVDGTLLGSYRHFDFVPWDDDADVLVNYKDMGRLMKILDEQTLFDELAWTNKSDIIKIFHKSSKKAGKYRWNFPFIDIFFYQENATHIWRKTKIKSFMFTAPKSDVFPLKLRPFGQYWMPVARNMVRFIKSTGMKNFQETCASTSWSHRNEKMIKSSREKCSSLEKYYAFVETNEETQMIHLDKRHIIYLVDVEFKTILFHVDLYL